MTKEEKEQCSYRIVDRHTGIPITRILDYVSYCYWCGYLGDENQYIDYDVQIFAPKKRRPPTQDGE